MPDTQIIEARVEQIVGSGVMYVTTRDGVTLKAPHTSQACGEIVHVRVKARQTLLAQEVGEPGALGDLTPPPPTVEQALALIERAIGAGEAGPLPPPPPRQYAAQAAAIPGVPEHYVPNPEVVKKLDRLFRMSDHGKYVRCMITGDTGVGKTSTILAEAARRGRPVFITEGGEINSPDDWFGQMILDGNGTKFIPHPVVAALREPGTVWIIDEASRVRTPQCFNPLMGLLSDLRTAYCQPMQEHVTIADGVMVFCTMNVGAEYTGTTTQDIALQNRMSYPIRMDYLPVEAEERALVERCRLKAETATSLVAFAWKLRDQARAKALPFAPSTRTLIDIGNLITFGGASAQEAIEEVVLPRYEGLDDDNEALVKVQATLQGVFAGGQDTNIEQFGGGADAQQDTAF